MSDQALTPGQRVQIPARLTNLHHKDRDLAYQTADCQLPDGQRLVTNVRNVQPVPPPGLTMQVEVMDLPQVKEVLGKASDEITALTARVEQLQDHLNASIEEAARLRQENEDLQSQLLACHTKALPSQTEAPPADLPVAKRTTPRAAKGGA